MSEAVENTVEQNVPEEAVNISLGDLQLVHRIIDLASQRGAFRGAELTQVGGVFDKLGAFLAQVAAAQEAAEAEAEAEAEAGEEASTEE